MPLDVEARVLANTRLSSDYNVLALDAPAVARLARPGQFVMLKTAPGLDPLLRRPFSIYEILRHDDGSINGLTILNKRVGRGSSLLYGARPGDVCGVLGPLGQPFVPVDPPAEAWMVAGGVGLAPFVTLAEALAARGTSTTLYYGGRSAGDLHGREVFERLGVRLVLSTEDGTLGVAGRVTLPLSQALDARAGRPVTVYACGPTPMMRAVSQLATAAGVTAFVSLEPVMGCGMGGCYSCVVPVRHAGGRHFVRGCIDGPVFDGARLVWDAIAAH